MTVPTARATPAAGASATGEPAADHPAGDGPAGDGPAATPAGSDATPTGSGATPAGSAATLTPGDGPDLAALLAGAVAAVPGGAARPGQQRMADAVARAVATGEHLLVQAGTGTGKSLAYLVPALLVDGPVVVSTATLALQSQLVDHDLPRLADAAEPLLGRRPRFAVLKGRHHYLCLAKLEGATAEEPQDALFDAEGVGGAGGAGGTRWLGEAGRLGRQVQRLRDWAMETETGDRDELDPGVDDTAWRQVSIPARECVGAAKCPYGAECFAEAARERARAADIVVTNHSLLAIDMLAGGYILPPHDLLVVDEAHELADRVSSAAQAELTSDGVERAARRARALVEPEVYEALTEAGDALTVGLAETPAGRLVGPLPAALRSACTLLDAAARAALTGIGEVTSDDSRGVAKQSARAVLEELSATAQRLVTADERDVAWVEKPDGFGGGRPALVVAPLSVAGALATHLYRERVVVATSATLALGGSFDTIARTLGLAPAEPERSGVERRPAGPDPRPAGNRSSDPQSAGNRPTDHRSADHRSTWNRSTEDRPTRNRSADHRPAGNRSTEDRPTGSRSADDRSAEDHARSADDRASAAGGRGRGRAPEPEPAERPRWTALDVGSPFDYPKQGILYVAAHLPRPRESGLPDAAADELVRLVTALGGRTLGLFSSRRAAERAAEVLRARTDLEVLLQGEESLPLLVRRFREHPTSCLLGVMSLWQGVDVPGDACQLVVIDRLPFPRPDEPLAAARAAAVDAAGGSGFAAVSVPIAAVRLAQGAGRLIRSATDRGVVAVLDSRLHTARGYGQYVRRTLPPFWYTTRPDVVLGALARLAGRPG
jgi:ATP-dependent DNA helicase DinG